MIVDHPGCFLPDLTSQEERLPGGRMSSSSLSLLADPGPPQGTRIENERLAELTDEMFIKENIQ